MSVAALQELDLDRIGGLLIRVCGNVCTDVLRERGRQQRIVAVVDGTTLSEPDIAEAVADDHAGRWALTQMSRLSPGERVVLALRAQGRSNPEVALELGRTYKQVDNAMRRARECMRHVLQGAVALLAWFLRRIRGSVPTIAKGLAVSGLVIGAPFAARYAEPHSPAVRSESASARETRQAVEHPRENVAGHDASRVTARRRSSPAVTEAVRRPVEHHGYVNRSPAEVGPAGAARTTIVAPLGSKAAVGLRRGKRDRRRPGADHGAERQRMHPQGHLPRHVAIGLPRLALTFTSFKTFFRVKRKRARTHVYRYAPQQQVRIRSTRPDAITCAASLSAPPAAGADTPPAPGAIRCVYSGATYALGHQITPEVGVCVPSPS